MAQKEGLIIIAAEGCPACGELIKKLSADTKIKSKIRILDATKSLEAAHIVKDLGIIKVPTLVLSKRRSRAVNYAH